MCIKSISYLCEMATNKRDNNVKKQCDFTKKARFESSRW